MSGRRPVVKGLVEALRTLRVRAMAVTGPIPGMVISRLAVSSALAEASSSLSIVSPERQCSWS